jgi:hypothetical protein
VSDRVRERALGHQAAGTADGSVDGNLALGPKLTFTHDRFAAPAARFAPYKETARMTMPAPRALRRPGATGLALLAAGVLLAPGAAQAQLNPQELLKQVIPGASQDSGDAAAEGERACQRYAEDEGLDVRRVLETRRSGDNNLEVTLSVEDRDDRFEARCVYDSGDGEVRELEPVRGTTEARGRDGDDDEVDERLARRAQDACEELAQDRDLDDVDFEGVRARGRDTVEVEMQARVRGDRRDFTCLYDDDQR